MLVGGAARICSPIMTEYIVPLVVRRALCIENSRLSGTKRSGAKCEGSFFVLKYSVTVSFSVFLKIIKVYIYREDFGS